MGIWEYVILESTIDKIGTKLVILSLIENPTLGFLQKKKKNSTQWRENGCKIEKKKRLQKIYGSYRKKNAVLCSLSLMIYMCSV